MCWVLPPWPETWRSWDYQHALPCMEAARVIRLILALIAILPLICFAEIYKWTDESGRVHFGDKPKDKGRKPSSSR